jgi:DNA-binding NtrC family response regulator
VLEEGEVERIGATKPVHVDVRVIVATHRNLQTLVRDSKFRQDLFHRVYVFPLVLPPLRERCEDIPRLVEHFAAQVCAQNNWKPVKFTAEAINALQKYPWPGNVRELRNMVERLMLLATGSEVDLDTVRLVLSPATESHAAISLAGSGTLAERVEKFEREVLLNELKRSGFHMTNAAKALGLERSHLYKKAEQLGIDLKKERREEE